MNGLHDLNNYIKGTATGSVINFVLVKVLINDMDSSVSVPNHNYAKMVGLDDF